MENFADNHYVRLGVSKNATPEEIRSAYHDAARRLHPDTNPDPEATELFLRIQQAYEVLSVARKRQAYDLTLPQVELTPGIEVNLLYSRKALVPSAEPQVVYILLELEATPEKKETRRPPINLCIVADCSTSMQGPRLDMLKATTRELIQQLQTEDSLALVAFSDRAEVILPATRGIGPGRLASRISLLSAGGGTEIYHGLQAGMAEATRYLDASHRNHLILITDGHTYGDEPACLSLADEAREKGLTLSALGIGSEWNDTFLDQLTTKTGGSSMYVSRPADIRRFLELKFKGLSQTYAENVRLRRDANPLAEIRYLFRLQPEPASLPTGPTLNLGNVDSKTGLAVLFEFLVDPVREEATHVALLEGTLKMDIPTRLIPATQVHVQMGCPIMALPSAQPAPQKLVQAMSRLVLYRMQEQARNDLADGKIAQATRRLQNLATHLLAQGEGALASTVLFEASRIEKGGSFSEEGEKRIKYGTRALLLPPGTDNSL